MPVNFDLIDVGMSYSRNELAEIWGYRGYQALARGVVTPSNDNKIILFVTAKKQNCMEAYEDILHGNTLSWEGPNDHFAEQRMINSENSIDEIHLFYRSRHHMDFRYFGQVVVSEVHRFFDRSSRFTLTINN
jgi:hypothetical protein